MAEKYDGFTAVERAAMKARARELKATETAAELEKQVLAAIAELPQPDRGMANKLHSLVKTVAPHLSAKLWYGMPAWTLDGKMVCFFQSAEKFRSRYPTLGFSDLAQLDDGAMWPTSYALTALGAAEEKAITALLVRATA